MTTEKRFSLSVGVVWDVGTDTLGWSIILLLDLIYLPLVRDRVGRKYDTGYIVLESKSLLKVIPFKGEEKGPRSSSTSTTSYEEVPGSVT